MLSSLLKEKTQDTVKAPVIDWKGSLGPSATTSLNNGAYDYRTFTTVNYGRDDWNLALRWRHLPTAIDAAQAVINSNIEAGLAPANTPPSTELGAQSSYDVFDLSGSYVMGQRTTELRYGVDNLFDTAAGMHGRSECRRSASEPVRRPDGSRLLRHPGPKLLRGRERELLGTALKRVFWCNGEPLWLAVAFLAIPRACDAGCQGRLVPLPALRHNREQIFLQARRSP